MIKYRKDIDYINEKGLDVIRQHANEFIAKREAPAYIANDGAADTNAWSSGIYCPARNSNMLQGVHPIVA